MGRRLFGKPRGDRLNRQSFLGDIFFKYGNLTSEVFTEICRVQCIACVILDILRRNEMYLFEDVKYHIGQVFPVKMRDICH